MSLVKLFYEMYFNNKSQFKNIYGIERCVCCGLQPNCTGCQSGAGRANESYAFGVLLETKAESLLFLLSMNRTLFEQPVILFALRGETRKMNRGDGGKLVQCVFFMAS